MSLCFQVFIYFCFAVVKRKRRFIWWTRKYVLRGMRESLLLVFVFPIGAKTVLSPICQVAAWSFWILFLSFIFPSFLAKLPSGMYFVIVTEFTTALPCVPRDRKPINSWGARAAFWDGTVAVQDRLYTPQSNPGYNTGTVHLPTIPLMSRDVSINEIGRFDEISSNWMNFHGLDEI